MDQDFETVIKWHALEYIAEDHIYVVDGVIVPSITQLIRAKMPDKYANVPADVLEKAAAAGTAVHEAIEAYCKDGTMTDSVELRNFIFLKKQYGFEVLNNELPVILFWGGEPIAAGRIDMIVHNDNGIGGIDIKRTAALDKEYLSYQLNLYRLAYEQCCGVQWTWQAALHLRNDTRKMVGIPIAENKIYDLITDYINGRLEV